MDYALNQLLIKLRQNSGNSICWKIRSNLLLSKAWAWKEAHPRDSMGVLDRGGDLSEQTRCGEWMAGNIEMGPFPAKSAVWIPAQLSNYWWWFGDPHKMCISPAERYSDHKGACWEHQCLVSRGKRIVLQHQRKHQEREPGYLENDLVVTWLGSCLLWWLQLLV